MELGRVHLNLKTVLLTMMMFKWGIFCSASSDTCLSAPCQNGATCIDNQDDYVCICPRDGLRYMGKDCHQLYDACSFAPCEECTSVPGTLEYHCVCPDGLSGDNCTEDVDECESGPCSEPRSSCIDRLNGYFCRCPAGHGGDHCRTRVTDCIDEPCQNNGTCVLLAEGFSCRCADGFEGLYCEEDVNECSSQPCQNGAICMDGVAEFHCFCVPGFQGFNCEIDINECASRPCENNATCINEKDRYECECLHGFSGVNCETEIDECESNPCQNKATCYDLIGTYSCECMPGFNGTDCEVDVDECASEPCQNGAACHDLVNSYACDCTETGFMGDHCEEDILECSSGPCQHGATCLEGVKEYNCLCWPGYDGQHCEVDVDECATQPCQNAGDCFERSDPSHWELDWELDYADAAGYICQCQTGFTGENCSVNIDECESDPCQNGGICEDQINGYTCTCAAGFTGDICEINIDECESQPCHNGGWCDDSVASYICHCPDAEPGKLPWGGDRCHVKLYGCVENECQNGATCHPWLKDEVHGHTCLCPHGFYDEHCSTQTTFSFSALGFVHIEVVQEDRRRRGVEQREHLVQGVQGVQLRFRTTLTNMLLFYRGDGTNFLLLEIVSSGLHAKAVVEESVLDVTFPGLVSDGDWWDANAFVTKDSLVLIIKGPGCEPQGCKIVDGDHNGLQLNPLEAFTHVYVGGAPDGLLEQTVSGAGFLGCMEDLKIDSKPILPQDLPEDQSHELGCSKTDWCESEPCSGHGHCIDLWINYQCDCHRPFRSESCSEESQSWTYSHEDTVSYSKYRVGSSHKGNFSVSFFMRSVKPEGLLFQLRRRAEEEGDQGEVYFSVYLGMGRMFVSSRPHSTPLTAPIYVTTGDRQLLHVEVQHRQVIFEHAGLRYGIGEIPEVEVNSGDWAYVGGLPRGWDSDTWGGHFKGCLQDLRLDTVPLVLEALKSSEEESSYLASYAENIQIGCVSDDTCQVEPCENEGSCSVTFNDFTCSCPERYTGKSCETRVWCATDPCVNGGRCVDLKDGYECVYNATFENNPVRYSAGGTLFEPVTAIYIELRTRSENAVLLRANHGSDLLLVGLLDSSLHVKIHAGNNVETLAFTGIRRLADGQWHRVTIAMAEQEKETSHWVITVDGITDASSMPELAGSIQFLNDEKAVLSIAESFTGCLGAVRLGGVYLPYVDHHGAPQSSQFHLVGTTKVDVGCKSAPVCDSDPCQNGARCEDLFNKYGCVCGAGWTGERCQIDLDDCVSGPCAHGSCKDYLSGFECECQPGYAGTLCDEDLNECEHHACEHGGTCKDGPNTYTCICPKEFTGPLCQWEYPPAECGKDVQCLNEGFCNDGPWGANCTCMPGYTGVRCEMDVDECASNPCRNGGSCLDRFNRFLCVCPPGHSGPVCDTNKQAQKDRVPWLVVAIPLVCIGVLIFVISLTIMVLTARKKRQSEGAYSPSSQELAGARLEMDSMFKVPPEERLI